MLTWVFLYFAGHKSFTYTLPDRNDATLHAALREVVAVENHIERLRAIFDNFEWRRADSVSAALSSAFVGERRNLDRKVGNWVRELSDTSIEINRMHGNTCRVS